MTLNYVLLTITAILSGTGIIEIVRGGVAGGHPFRTISTVIVFAIALIATLAGIDYAAFKIMVESALRE
jgi:hypothetical protein